MLVTPSRDLCAPTPAQGPPHIRRSITRGNRTRPAIIQYFGGSDPKWKLEGSRSFTKGCAPSRCQVCSKPRRSPGGSTSGEKNTQQCPHRVDISMATGNKQSHCKKKEKTSFTVPQCKPILPQGVLPVTSYLCRFPWLECSLLPFCPFKMLIPLLINFYVLKVMHIHN